MHVRFRAPCLVVSFILGIALTAASPQPAAAATLYVSTGGSFADGGGQLYRIDTVTQTVELIGETGLSRLGGIEFHPSGVLYGVDGGSAGPSTLYTIDPNTAEATPVGGDAGGPIEGIQGVDALRFDSDGTLWGGGWDASAQEDGSPIVGRGFLVTIDHSTGTLASSVMMSGSGDNAFVAGLAFNSAGTLFGSRGNAEGRSNDLVTIDPDSGVHTPIGGPTRIISDIWFDSDGTLYGVSPSGDVLTINPTTGIANVLFRAMLPGTEIGIRAAGLTGIPTPRTTIATLVGTGEAGFNGDGVVDFLPAGPPAGDGVPDRQVNYPDGGIVVEQNGNIIFADTNNHRVRRIVFPSTPGGAVTIETIAGTGVSGFNGDVDENGNRRAATTAQLSSPTGVAKNHVTGDIYVVDSLNHRVVEIDGPTGQIRTVAGSPTAPTAGFVDQVPAADARFDQPLRVAVSGNTLIVSDPGNGRVRRVNLGSQTVDTIAGTNILGLAGDGGPAISARFGAPIGIAVDSQGRVVVADKLNNRVRRFTIGGNILTIAGSGVDPFSGAGLSGFSGDGGPATSARLDSPVDVAIDQAGNILIADQGNRRIRKIDAATGIITTFAGDGTDFGSPSGVAITPTGAVVVDTLDPDPEGTQGQKIRAILPPVIIN